MNDTVSMEVLARFAILPGAADLVAAFCDIPPGPMRDAVIHLAQTTANTYRGAGHAQTYSPIPPIGQRGGVAQIGHNPHTRTGRTPPTGDAKTEAVRLRMEGQTVNQIMAATGLSKQDVYQATYEARKAGLKIPSTRGKGIEPGSKTWHTSVDQLSGQGLRMVTIAADSRGIGPQDYLDRRQTALKLAQEGASYETILKATGERDAKVVSAWLSAARGAGHNVPYVVSTETVDREPEAIQEPEPEPEPESTPPEPPVVRIFTGYSSNGAHAAIQKAAERRSMTVAAYEELRESIVQHRKNGKTPLEIATMTGEATYFVKDTIDYATAKGVQFPPLTIRRHAG